MFKPLQAMVWHTFMVGRKLEGGPWWGSSPVFFRSTRWGSNKLCAGLGEAVIFGADRGTVLPERSMSDLASRIRAVHLQVARLVAERDGWRKRLAALEHEQREHHRNAEVLQARIAELERENEVLRVTRPAQIQRPEGQVEAKQRIDELVSEIDRCLALLTH
jgi:hypothetical protein